MEKIRLGRTNLLVTKTSFGALPVQRRTLEDGAALLRAAYDAGINFFDTARAYSDSEQKIQLGLGDVRENIIIATKTQAKTGTELERDLETSLKTLGTDYIDIYQFHNPSFIPMPGGEDGLYDAALKAKQAGKIRHIGITSHNLDRALAAVKTGLFATMQFPFSMISDEREEELVHLCEKEDVGFICMKALSGGLVRDIEAAFAYLYRYANVVPIWGIQKKEELDQFIALDQAPPAYDEQMAERVKAEKEALGSDFCRGCGYCMPCPAGIPIPMAARMILMLNRAPYQNYITPQWRADMEKIDDCLHCGQCTSHCPYELNTPELLTKQLIYYREFCQEKDAASAR